MSMLFSPVLPYFSLAEQLALVRAMLPLSTLILMLGCAVLVH